MLTAFPDIKASHLIFDQNVSKGRYDLQTLNLTIICNNESRDIWNYEPSWFRTTRTALKDVDKVSGLPAIVRFRPSGVN